MILKSVFFLCCIAFCIFYGLAENVQKKPCGNHRHTTTVGHIQPRNATLAQGTQCFWTIEPAGSGAEEIFLIVTEFFMNDDDELVVSDLTTNKTLFSPFHGKIGPFSLLTGTLKLGVLLKASNSTFPSRKFQADYVSNCSYAIRPPASSGILVSPLYTSERNDTVICTWNLKPFESTEKLYLVFQSFSLSGSKLLISGSDNQDGQYSNTTPPDIVASGHMVLTFHLDTSKPHQIFRAIYEPVSRMCSQFLKLDKDHPSVNLASPSVEDVYELKYGVLRCYWIIMGTNGTLLQLKFQRLHLNGSLDLIAISDGGSMLSQPLGEITVLNQDDSIGKVFTSSGSYMWLAFSTPFLQLNVGFAAEVTMISSLSWNTLDAVHNTDEELEYNSSKLSSPEPHHCGVKQESLPTLTKGTCGDLKHNQSTGHLWPKGCVLKGNKQCAYNITSLSGEIFLIVDQFFMFPDDTMQITPLNNPSTILFGPYNGVKETFSILSGSNEIQVFVETSRTPGKRTFAARFNSSDCYDDNGQPPFVESSGKIVSPIYSPDQSDVECTYRLQAPNPSDVISVAFSKIIIYGNSNLSVNVENATYSGQFSYGFVGVTSIILRLDRSIPDQTVQFQYETASKICSENIHLNEKIQSLTINLPSYKTMSSSGLRSLACQWVITSPPNTVIGINVTSLNLLGHNDEFIVNDGGSYFSKNLWTALPSSQNLANAHYLRTSKNELRMSFTTPFQQMSTTLNVTVTMYDQGGYKNGSGDILVHSTTDPTEIIYLLEVNPKEQVMLTVDKFCSTCSVYFYEDFSDSTLIGKLEGSRSSYPIFSRTSKMMVVIKDIKESNFSASFKGVSQGCNKITVDSSDSYILSGQCNATCSWIINPQDKFKNGILVLQVSFFIMEHSLSFEIYHMDNMTKVASLSPSVDNIPPIYLSASSGVYIEIKRGPCQEHIQNAVLFASVVTLPGCSSSIDLAAPKTIQVLSPDFPNLYPWLAKCWWNITSTNSLYLSIHQLQFAPGHCLKIYDGATLVATFNGQNSSYHDMLLESSIGFNFMSTTCDGRSSTEVASGKGFAVNVTAVDCGSYIKNVNGSFSSPGFPHSVTNTLLCRWIVSVPPTNADGDVNIISYEISWSEGDAGVENLKVYDGPSLQYPEIVNISASSLLSRTNTLVFVYQQNQSEKLASGFSVSYEAHACLKTCHNGICMHADWVCNGVNDCGDFSDERNCKSLLNSGVPVWAMSLSVPFTFLIGGILGAIFIPYLKNRYRISRQGQYSSVAIINEIDE